MTVPPADRPPRRILGVVIVGVFVVPWIIGMGFIDSLDWRLRAIPQTWVLVSFGALCALFLATPGRRARARMQNSFLGRHPHVLMVLAALFAFGMFAFGAQSAADLLAPADVTTVEITSTSTAGRGPRLRIYTAGPDYTTPLFWVPRVERGPARLTLGHYSGLVLRVEQPP